MLSVSGCRGIVGASLTPEFVARYVCAFASWLMTQAGGRGAVVVGRDGRQGGEVIAECAKAALRASGLRVIDLGVATTPTVGLMVLRHKTIGGLVVTASHNPGEWNGLKPITAQGGAPPPDAAKEILARYQAGASALVGASELGDEDADDSAAHVHVATVLESLASVVSIDAIRARGFRVALDSVNASGARGGRMLLEAVGCQVTHVHADGSGVFPHTPEPTEANLKGFCEVVKSSGLDLGFAQDPDADRLAIVGAQGVYIGEEYTLALAARAILGSLSDPSGACVAANLSTSRMIDDAAGSFGAQVVRTPVGEANVVQGMDAGGCVLAGEGNGGVIWPVVVPIRDSIGAMALVLALLTRENASLAELVARFPSYSIVKRKQALPDGDASQALDRVGGLFAQARADRQDGLRLDFDDQAAWLHVRASNTEPILRLIAEAPTEAAADALCDEAERAIAHA
jgi:phosphomannomutase